MPGTMQNDAMPSRSRRKFLAGTAASVLPVGGLSGFGPARNTETPSFFEVSAGPDSGAVFRGLGSRTDLSSHAGEWREGDLVVRLGEEREAIRIRLSAPSAEPTQVRLRWKGSLPADARILGDAWERSYGELGWEACRAERSLPWYA